MKIALFGTNKLQFSKVYTPEVLEKLGEYGELSDRINQKLKGNADFLLTVKSHLPLGVCRNSARKKSKNICLNSRQSFSAGTVQYCKTFRKRNKGFQCLCRKCGTHGIYLARYL